VSDTLDLHAPIPGAVMERCRERLQYVWAEQAPMTPIDEALLRKTMEHISAEPESWNQRVWRSVDSCGTVACLAGWTATLAGGQWIRSALSAEDEDAAAMTFDGYVLPKDRAQRLLGLTELEAYALFSASNSWDDLRAIAHLLVHERPEVTR
jgi:hypothetical protein